MDVFDYFSMLLGYSKKQKQLGLTMLLIFGFSSNVDKYDPFLLAYFILKCCLTEPQEQQFS